MNVVVGNGVDEGWITTADSVCDLDEGNGCVEILELGG